MHNHAQDTVCTSAQASGFITSKQVAVFPETKTQAIERDNPSGGSLSLSLYLSRNASSRSRTADLELSAPDVAACVVDVEPQRYNYLASNHY